MASWFLPRTIIDLNKARPVDLAVIDGISTMDKGEGTWVPDYSAPLRAYALASGKNAVKTDAVGMQVMGFNPLAPNYTEPFVVSENWLLRAKDKGLGDPPDPSKIVIAGAQTDEFTVPFHACEKNPSSMAKSVYQRMKPYCGLHPDDARRSYG
ncbi:hypothetical protein JW948_04115 [bacterium]|nr:hypothetical protein [bacterium]